MRPPSYYVRQFVARDLYGILARAEFPQIKQLFWGTVTSGRTVGYHGDSKCKRSPGPSPSCSS